MEMRIDERRRREIAPGVDLERDVLEQARIELQVSPDLTQMEPRLFLPQPLGLTLTEPEVT